MQQRGVARGCPHLSRRSVAKTEPQRRFSDDDVPFYGPHELNDAVSLICPQAESARGYCTESQIRPAAIPQTRGRCISEAGIVSSLQ